MHYDCPSNLPGDSFQAAVQGQVIQTKLNGLTELNKWISEFKEINVAKICEVAFQRKGTFTKRERKRERSRDPERASL